MVWEVIAFDIWLCFSLLGKSSRPQPGRELGLLCCPEQGNGASAVGTGTAHSPGSCPSALREWHWDVLDRQQLLSGVCGMFGVKQNAHLGLALGATAESSCSCEQNLPWV